MSDAGAAGAARAAPEAAAIASGAAAPAGAAGNGAAAGTDAAAPSNGAAAGDDAGEGTAAFAWPEDWRERSAGGDEKKLARLRRFASPETVAAALLQTQDRLRSGQFTPALPEDASPEEIAAFRKQAGIPEKADGYGLAFPAGVEPTEADKAELTQFQERAHAAHVPPGHVKALFDTYVEMRQTAAQARYEAAQEAAVATQAELRAEYGRDYPRFFGKKGADGVFKGGLVNEFLAEHFGDDGPAIMDQQLANGQKLGSDPRFVRGALKMALAYADDDTIRAGSGQGGKTIEDEIKELNKLDRLTPDQDARLTKLQTERAAREIRQGRAGRAP